MTDPGVRRSHLHRADHRADRREDHRARAARCAAADARRTDGLNLAIELAEAGVLDRYGVELIGAKHRRDQEGGGPRPLQGGDAAASGSTCRAAACAHTCGRGRAIRRRDRPAADHPPVAHPRRHGRQHRRRPTEEFERFAALGTRRVADQRGADRGVDRRLEGVRARGDARPQATTSSSSARSRTSTRWACTPATASPWRRRRR